MLSSMVNISDIRELHTPKGVNLESFLVALTLYMAGLLLSFLRWHLLLKGYNVAEPFTRTSLVYLASYAVFSFTPLGRLGSEGARVTVLIRDSGRRGVIASVAYERLLDGFSILGLFAGWIIALAAELDPFYTSVGFMALIPLILAAKGSVSRFSVRVEGWIRRLPRIGSYVNRMIRFGGTDIKDPPVRIQVLSAAITVSMWLLNLSHIAVLLKALGIDNILIGAPAVLLVEMLGLGLPVPLPAGLGVMDFLTAITLKAAGLGTGFVGQYLIVERIIITVIPGILGVIASLHLGISLAWRKQKQA